MNDPLGAMSKGLSTAASAASKAYKDNIQDNEALHEAYAQTKANAWQGIKAAGSAASNAGTVIKQKGGELYDKNYHGQLYDKMGNLANAAGE